jgi:hypothetical protein
LRDKDERSTSKSSKKSKNVSIEAPEGSGSRKTSPKRLEKYLNSQM